MADLVTGLLISDLKPVSVLGLFQKEHTSDAKTVHDFVDNDRFDDFTGSLPVGWNAGTYQSSKSDISWVAPVPFTSAETNVGGVRLEIC